MLGMDPEARLPAPPGAALRAKAPPFGYLPAVSLSRIRRAISAALRFAPLDSSHTHTRTTVRGGNASAASFASNPPDLTRCCRGPKRDRTVVMNDVFFHIAQELPGSPAPFHAVYALHSAVAELKNIRRF